MRLRRPDRVARDDRDAADDPVGEEGALVVAEEVRLVGAQHERRERVDAPGGDEVARAGAARAPPGAAGIATARASASSSQAAPARPGTKHREREPVAELAWRDASSRGGARRAAPRRLAQSEAEREGLVGREPVQPERDARRRRRSPAASSSRAQRERRARRGIAGRVEVVPPRDEHDGDERGRDARRVEPWNRCSSVEPPSSASATCQARRLLRARPRATNRSASASGPTSAAVTGRTASGASDERSV